MCQDHLEYHQNKTATKNKLKRAARLCLDCEGKLAELDVSRCAGCKESRNKIATALVAERKAECVALLGGACVDCGLVSEYTAVYDFHHPNPEGKDFNVAKIYTYRWETLMTELKKCVLVCANCHRIRHAKEALAVPEIAELISA